MKTAVTRWLFFCLAVSCAFAAKVKDLPAKYQQWLQKDVAYIISKEEKDTFLLLASDQERDTFIERFWEVRNPTPGAPGNPYKDEIYRRIAYANQYFGHESGTEGWRSAMGRIYITLGEPKQKALYLGYNKLRPMQIWFYSNDNPALPPFFYIVFYRPDSGGDYRVYSPYMDGPEKLVTTDPGSRIESLKVIHDQAGAEVARTALSLIPDEPVDTTSARPSLQSDVMLATIRDLPNRALSKQQLNMRRELMEGITHRVILGGEFLDAVAVPLRDADGNTALHYILREQKPEDFAVGQAKDGRYYYALDIAVHVSTADGHLLFAQERSVSEYFDRGRFDDEIGNKAFAYEGLLPLAPGKYKLEFVLTDRLKKTGFRTEKEITVPVPSSNGFSVTDLVPFSSSRAVGQADPALIPFGVAGVKFTPMLGSQLDFVEGENLQILYQIWAPAADPRIYEGKKVEVKYGYGRPGVPGDSKTLQEEVSREQFDANGSLVSGRKIPLVGLYPGNYRLSVTVSDPVTQQKAYASLQFRILRNRALPATWYLVDPHIAESVRNGSWDYERGMCYLASGDKKAAEHWFQQSLQRNPANPEAQSHLVDLYFEQQALAKVVELYTRSPVTDGTAERTVLRIAESLEKTGNVKLAVAVLESAISSKKTSGPLYLMLASCYQEMGERERAQEFERKGKSLMASSPPAS